MRAYFFGNFYLSSIQQGIQAQHCTAEMFLKYTLHGRLSADFIGESQRNMLYEWAREHKTSILLSGGDRQGLTDVFTLLDNPDNTYPWAFFNESNEALNHTLTCVGIILPEKIYEDKARKYVRMESRKSPGDRIMWRPENIPDLTPWEFGLIDHMNQCSMAR